MSFPLRCAPAVSGASPGSSVGNLTGGLVGDGAKPSFLPVVTPAASAVLVLLSMAPALCAPPPPLPPSPRADSA